MSNNKHLEKQNKVSFTIRVCKLLHFVVSIALYFVAWVAFYTYNDKVGFDHRYSYYLLIAYAVILLFFNRLYNSYEVEYERISGLAYSQTLSDVIGVVAIYGLVSVAWHHLYNMLPFLVLIVVQLIFNCLWSKFAHDYFYNHTPKLKTILIYRDEGDRRKIREVETFYRRFKVVDKLEDPKNIREIQDAIAGCEAVLVAGVDASLRNGIVKQCVENDIQCFFAPHIGDIIVSSSQYEQAFSSPVFSVRTGYIKLEYALVKRLVDIVLSALAIVVFSPLMLITAIAIVAQDGHTPIYKQIRLTKDRREFSIYKFRSMRIDAEADGKARLAAENDDRITPVGKIIRMCRLDELPQLFNILKGDMTIVGPRPERPEIAAEYEKELPEFKLRLKVKAGLTGYAQIYGKYNTNPYEKLEMDLLYISRMSILTDLMLMFATVKILFIKDSTEGVDKGKETAK